MNISKCKLSTLATAIVLASPLSYAEIELGNGLSVSGFVDMSFVYTDADSASSTTKVFGVDQVETDFMYTGSDGVTAQVDIEYGESSSGSATNEDETFVEQAFITKQITDSFSLTAGRFLSYSGWETEEPTGLFQYSGTGYGSVFYGGYQQGVSGKLVASDALAITVSVVNDLFNPIDSDTTNLGTELGLHITPAEGVTAKAFYLSEGDTTAINLWASLAVDALTLAVEYNMAEDTTAVGDESDGYLLMANYAMGDAGITLRYHAYETENSAGTTITEMDGITIAPSYAVSDNLLLVAEYRMDSDDIADSDTDTLALEALYTF